jgi:cytochrome c1
MLGKKWIFASALGLVLAAHMIGAAKAAEAETPPRNSWSFAGPFGMIDRAQLQRGLKVYREVCSVCHGITLVSFRNLAEEGGPGYTPQQAATIAREHKFKEINESGRAVDREGRLADSFPPPFANEQIARLSNNGTVPPDLSLIAKARTYERGFPWFVLDMFTQYQEQGVDYLTALLQGYEDTPPADFTLPSGSSYNKYFPGHALSMPPPLTDGRVEYTDGSPETVAQYAKDVAAFLMWTAEPHMEARKRIGVQVMIFLIAFAGLLYFTKKKVWSKIDVPA